MRYVHFLKDTDNFKNENNNDAIEVKKNEKSFKDNSQYQCYLKNSLKYDREMLKYRLKKILSTDSLPGLDEEFDLNIKQ